MEQVKLEATLQKSVKAKKRLDIRKQQLAEVRWSIITHYTTNISSAEINCQHQAEETLAEKKEKLQRLHKDLPVVTLCMNLESKMSENYANLHVISTPGRIRRLNQISGHLVVYR